MTTALRRGFASTRRWIGLALIAARGFGSRHAFEVLAAAVSLAGVAIAQHAVGALARVPLSMWRAEREHRKQARRRHEREGLERSCLDTIEAAVVELVDSPMWLDSEMIFRISHDEPVTIRGLGELSASARLRRLGWLVNQGYRLAERLRGSWSAFETATSRCAGVLVDGPAPRLIDAVVVALKEAEHAAGELAQIRSDVSAHERQRLFNSFGVAVERAVRAASELERHANPAGAIARIEELTRDRARRRYARFAADRAAASAAQRLRGDLAIAELLEAERGRFLRESPPGRDISQPVLERVRQVVDAMNRLIAATRDGASDAELAIAREDLQRSVRALDETAERQEGEHDEVSPSP